MRIRTADRTGTVVTPLKKREAAASGAVAPAARPPADSAEIMGVPEPELTPNVQRALLSLMGEVDALRGETEKLRARMRDLESLADHDPLLPVLNRRAFLREVSRAVALAERHNAPSALVYLDLNGFKAINDRFGHAAGDAALAHVAALLTAQVRETDAVGRLGGDEFGVVLTLTAPKAAEKKAESLIRAIATTPFQHDGREHRLSAAWGAYALTPGVDADAAMAEADAAMYARKQAMHRATG